MWKEAFESGEVVGDVFADVPRALKYWKKRGVSVYIYSSGSVQAQQLLFGHSRYGDLSGYLSGHYDTGVGGKRESSSYGSILRDLGCSGEEVLFVSDIVDELDAASSAGMQVRLSLRAGNAEQRDASRYTSISSLWDLIAARPSSKRKRVL
jgi:enolase-phosphatase E1